MTFSEPYMDYDVTIQDGKYASVESGWDIHGTYDSIPLMQYTGLKDKNGKEIYEGDVLCIEDYYHDYQDGIAINKIPDNRIEQVSWDESGMWMTDNNTLIEECAISEIIGNIYEHSHLLNGMGKVVKE